ncbi:MAG: hypothetical protein C9356_11945 [Oleiphilus sp.]|nr:MAG: hypothetical protein C9356_11945 [Oleiphilus sp.]
MFAFYKSESAFAKVFDRTEDWQITDGTGQCERWFSVWRFDKKASLEAALESYLDEHFDAKFNPENLVIC